jgi:hypothetical protein
MTKPLEFHPLADLFPLMEGAEFDALVADIKKNGLRCPIDLYQGKILDGRNRYRACLAAGIEAAAGDFEAWHREKHSEADARAYVISQNILRRHLTAEQRRDFLVKLVAAQPGKADRAIARDLGAGIDHKQVGRARRKGESTGAIDPVQRRTGADGRTRRRPAKKSGTKKTDGKAATGAEGSGSFERWQAEARQHVTTDPATTGATAAPAAKPERSEILAADARWAATMAASNGDAACWLLSILKDDERRVAFVNALASALIPADAATGNDTDPAASAERMKEALAEADYGEAEEADDEDEKPRRRRRKVKEVEVKLGDAVHDAFTDLADLGEECRAVVDNAPPGIDQTQRIQTFEATTDELDNLQEPTVPAELAELPVKYLPGRVTSRASRCYAATEILEKCMEALATIPEGDERRAAASELSSELEGAIDVRDTCEFPGMFG